MRVDFREERRWKLALAYNLSTAVLEWHYAKTPEERQKAGIVVKWKRSRTHLEDDNTDSAMDMSLDDLDRALKPGQLLGLDYDTEEEEEEEEEEGNQGDTVDPLEPSVAIRDALDSAREIQPKAEEMEDQSVLQLVQVPEDAPVQSEIDNKLDDDLKQGLKSTSENPLLSGSKSSSQSVNGDGDPAPVSTKPSKSSLAPLRQKIVHSDDLFFDLSDISASLTAQTQAQDLPPQHLDMQTLFPDLQPFGLLDVSPNPVITNGETKKKSEKKSDKDDPTKRAEDLNYAKLFPTGRFMHTKPTLIGPLQPAKRYKDDTWLPVDPQAVTPDVDGNNRVSEEISNGKLHFSEDLFCINHVVRSVRWETIKCFLKLGVTIPCIVT
jgi:chromatin modification-related protein VID21